MKKRLWASDGVMTLDVTLTIQPGELVTIFGPSGAGKTSILRMIAGLLTPDEGCIRVGDEVWFDSARGVALPPQRRRVGFVFQDYALFPHMTVRENLEYALENRRDRAFVDELLEIMDLRALADRKPPTLSGGQQQRVALARALVRRPRLLLLDEPLSALDVSTRLRLQDEILRLHRFFQTTTLLVSHDLTEMFKLSDRVFVLEGGRIVRMGRPAEVFVHGRVSGKFRFIGEVVDITPEDVVYVITVLVGNHAVCIVADEEDVRHLRVGDRVMVFSKMFQPVLVPLTSHD